MKTERIKKAILDSVVANKFKIEISTFRLTIAELINVDQRFERITLDDFLKALYEIDPLEVDALIEEENAEAEERCYLSKRGITNE